MRKFKANIGRIQGFFTFIVIAFCWLISPSSAADALNETLKD